MAVNISNLFDANFYSAANPDLAAAGLTTNAQLLSHFQAYGLNEGRAFSPLVDLNFYRASNSDLASFNNKQALDHLENYGISEGRRFSDVFDLNFYRAANSDLSSLNNEQLFQHLENYGLAEGRQFSQFFDPNYYKANNPDLSQAGLNGSKQLLQNFEIYGLKQGQQFDPAFDVNYYRSLNPDLAAAGVKENKQLLDHFELYGLNEGRISSPAFDVKVYLANNSDLTAAHFNNQQAYTHFVLYGQKEGRPGSDYAGNTLDTARDITNGLLTKTWTDFVGATDTDDYYKFNLDNPTNLTIGLNNLNADVNVQLISSANNQVIGSSENNGAMSFALHSNSLAAGTYYIRVNQGQASANTNYNLKVSSFDLGGSPSTQNWLSLGTVPKIPPTNLSNLPTSTTNGDVTNLDSTKDPTSTGGYTSYYSFPMPDLLNPQFPKLDRTTGFTIDFDVKLNSETHSSNDQAGFNVIVLGSDRQGIELGYWNNEIWAKDTGTVLASDGGTLFKHDFTERVLRDTTVTTRYELSVSGNTYQLSANGSSILTGSVKDYSTFQASGLGYNPYQQPNFFFIGDDSTEAGANVDIAFVGVSQTKT